MKPYSVSMKSIVLLYIRMHYFFRRCGIRIRGLGWVQRFLKKEFVFSFYGKKVLYLPTIEGSYDYLLIGKPNEPETHTFITSLLSSGINASFIDVGASVGEFILGVSRYENIKQIFAFEPRPDCAKVLRTNKELNNEERITVIEKAAGREIIPIKLHLNPGGTSSGIYGSSENIINHITVKCTKLDAELPKNLENPIILVDVEGFEPMVLEGSANFIRKNSPLIIFEFNRTSKKHFYISDIENILGENYKIFRLRGDGKLDSELDKTWNCIAVNNSSLFWQLIQPLIKNAR